MTGRAHTIAALAIAQVIAAAGGAALGQEVHENSGRVCFETTPDGATFAEYWLDGCFSSSCTTVPERSLVATVTETPPIVQIRVRVVTADTGADMCTADCGGVPPIAFDLGLVPEDLYLVYLGDTPIGTWVPVPGAEAVCLPAS